jgi:aspartate/methionine/tyrosine aminotransferase
MASVLTWGQAPPGGPAARSRRLRELSASHHAMWNYTTYRDAIALVGLDARELYPNGTTRLDPARWADLGWLTCFCGPPESAVAAMREAVVAETFNQYTPDLLEPLRDQAAGVLGRERGAGFEVVGAEGAQAGLALTLLTTVDPGDEVIISDPGYFHVPSAIIACGATPVSVPITRESGYRLDPDAVAAAVTPRTRAVCLVDPVNPYGTVQTEEELTALAALADRHGLLLLHDVTHGPLRIGPSVGWRSLPALELTERAVAVFSVSHCWGMAGARLGFIAGPPGLMRDCLRMKAAITRLNTSLVAQHGALAALRDAAYLGGAEETIAANLARLEGTLRDVPGLDLAVRPQRGLACALEIDQSGEHGRVASARELMTALFARRVAVYPGDGLGDNGAATTVRLNLSRPDAWAMDRLDAVLAEALDEARSGRWREPVLRMLEGKGTERARRLAALLREPSAER